MITIIAFFTDNGIPKTGLSATVIIREVVTGDLVVPVSGVPDDMVELGDGLYKFEFNGDDEIDYAFTCNGGNPLTTADRFLYGGTELRQIHNNVEFIKQVESGRWKLDQNTNTMIFFDTNDNEILRFNLFDLSGVPTISDVAERKPV